MLTKITNLKIGGGENRVAIKPHIDRNKNKTLTYSLIDACRYYVYNVEITFAHYI